MLRIVVALLLAVLEGGNAQERAQAYAGLQDLLPAATPLIRARLDHPNPVLRARCRELLADPLPASPSIGKLAFIDAARGRVAGDLRPASEGRVWVVRREGRRIGSVVVVESLAWGCWLAPSAVLSANDLQRGDTLHRR